MDDPAERSDRPLRGGFLHERRLPKARLEAFSDGVFAIAITLLVLELKVPPPDTALASALVADWPAYLGYLISFAFIGGSWIAHSTATRFVREVDAGWMRLNLLLLLLVSLLPFTTSLMATHLNQADARVVTVLFGLNLTAAAGLVSVMVRYAAATGLAADDVAGSELVAFAKERRAAVALQATGTVVAVFFPVVAAVIFLTVSLLLLFDPLWRLRHRPAIGADGGR